MVRDGWRGHETLRWGGKRRYDGFVKFIFQHKLDSVYYRSICTFTLLDIDDYDCFVLYRDVAKAWGGGAQSPIRDRTSRDLIHHPS